MRKLPVKGIEKEIDRAEAIKMKIIDKLAEKIRTNYIAPFCLENNVEFLSGNGTYSFFRKEKGCDLLVRNEIPSTLSEALDLSVTEGSNLGSLIRDCNTDSLLSNKKE